MKTNNIFDINDTIFAANSLSKPTLTRKVSRNL